MKVTTIAYTTLVKFPESIEGTNFEQRTPFDTDEIVEDIDLLGEFAGRSCYQAWNMPNPKTATNDGYMANIISQEHFSVLEHGSVTFYLEGVSRALTHELIRHRHLSYSELSQRYVDMSTASYVVPPLMRETARSLGMTDEQIEAGWIETLANHADLYDEAVETLTEIAPTAARKQIREAARAVLPNAMETRIVVTGNLRAWRDFLKKRWHEAADAEIRECAGLILAELRRVAPNSVQDIPSEPYGYAK